jgi:putative oxidoreductase
MKFNIQKTKRPISVFLFLARLGIGCMFLWGSLPKIRQPYDFLSSVYSYELVGPKLGMFVAMTLPWLEIFVGICLIGGVFISGALLVSTGMAMMFTFVIGSALYHGLDITCGCFGASSTEIVNYSTLIRACVILLFSVAAYLAVITLRFHPDIQKLPA